MRSILLDTNLLVLLIVGLYDKSLINTHKRTNNFTPEDFDLLVESINSYEVLWFTSHCIAEVSNLLKQTNRDKALELMNFLSDFIEDKKESHIHKNILINYDASLKLGVADTGILVKAKRVTCVFTVDLDLYLELLKRTNRVVNFNHLRTEGYYQ